jgi:multiple sugar transport system substrate-binding protein
MKKIGLALCVLTMGASMVFAQGTTLRWAYWGSEARIKRSQQAIDIFQADNPSIKVNPEISGGTGDHFTKVDTQIAGGAGPDIIQMGGNIKDYVKKGVLLPLDSFAGNVLNTKVIDAGAIASGTVEGKLFGVSTGVTMPALVYNKTMLQKAGVPLPQASMTYQDFHNYLVGIKPRLPNGVWPMQDIGVLSSASVPFGYWTGYMGTNVYIAASNSTTVTPAIAKKYLDLFKDYRDNGLVPPADVAAGFAETNADTSAIIAGKVAIGFIWTNGLGGYQAATKDELGLIEFPGAAAAKALWQAPSQFYTVNKDSKNPEAAVKFINFLVNDPKAAKVLGNDRGASASSTARAAGLEGIDKVVIDYLTAAGPHTRPEGDHLPNDTEFNSTLYLIYQKVAFGQISTTEGGQQIYDLIARLIKK